jgi:hypothetical protein
MDIPMTYGHSDFAQLTIARGHQDELLADAARVRLAHEARLARPTGRAAHPGRRAAVAILGAVLAVTSLLAFAQGPAAAVATGTGAMGVGTDLPGGHGLGASKRSPGG